MRGPHPLRIVGIDILAAVTGHGEVEVPLERMPPDQMIVSAIRLLEATRKALRDQHFRQQLGRDEVTRAALFDQIAGVGEILARLTLVLEDSCALQAVHHSIRREIETADRIRLLGDDRRARQGVVT